MSETFKSLLDGPFSFTARPEPIAGDLRMSWGLAILLLSLLHSRSKKGNFQKLQLLAHAVRLPEGRADVISFIEGNLRATELTVRVEPWLNRAIGYAHALKLVSVDKGKTVTLLPKGLEVAKQLDSSGNILEDERRFLSYVAPKLTEPILKRVWRMEDLL